MKLEKVIEILEDLARNNFEGAMRVEDGAQLLALPGLSLRSIAVNVSYAREIATAMQEAAKLLRERETKSPLPTSEF